MGRIPLYLFIESEKAESRTMASKKKQQQKNKMKMLKKKKVAQAKLTAARNAAEEGAEKDRGGGRPEFGSQKPTGAKNMPSAPSMHRPQGG